MAMNLSKLLSIALTRDLRVGAPRAACAGGQHGDTSCSTGTRSNTKESGVRACVEPLERSDTVPIF
jgi:hypothetical protein